MKRFPVGIFLTIVLSLAFVFLLAAADLPPLNDGSDHGDPPFLMQSGWKPLLNGKNLDGWELVDPNKKGKWLVTSGVVWGGTTNPAMLIGLPTPGDRIVNTDVDPQGNAEPLHHREVR